MERREIFPRLRTVFDLLLFYLIIIHLLKSVSGVRTLPVNLVYVAILTTIVGVIGYGPELWNDSKGESEEKIRTISTGIPNKKC